MTRGRRALVALLLAATTGLPAVARSQEAPPYPPEVRFAVASAGLILTSASDVRLEAFAHDQVTGVYLLGSLAGEAESIGYGRDAQGQHYLWLSVSPSDSLDYLAMAYDVDNDLTPDFLLIRVADRRIRVERLTEYRSPAAAKVAFDISVQPVCAPPRCDPETWEIGTRHRLAVSDDWFGPWRALFGLAAMRGERWLGRPVAALGAVTTAPPVGTPPAP